MAKRKSSDIFSQIGPLATDIPNEPDTETFSERTNLEEEGQRQLIELRDKCSPFIFWLVVVWLGYVAVTVFFGSLWIAESVLVALVGGTTAGVIGLLAAIIKYVFSDHSYTSKSQSH